MSLIQVVAAALLVLGSYLVLQVALADVFDPRRRAPRREAAANDNDERPAWRRAA